MTVKPFIKANILVFYSFAVILLHKYKTLSREGVEGLFSFLPYAFQDQLILFFLFFFIYRYLKKLSFLAFFVFFFSLVNIIFISKMGYPITIALLDQLGDFLFLQTSIASKSIYRNILLISIESFIFLFIQGALFFKERFFEKIGRYFLVINLFSLFISFFMYGLHYGKIDGRFSRNIFFSLFSPPKTTHEILLDERFKSYKGERWGRVSASHRKIKPKNIVLVIVETLTEKMEKEELRRVLPNIERIKEKGIYFGDHYTPWPFSSKSLFSIMCGIYPHPSSLIEMRINKKENCSSWVESLVKKYNFNSYLFYTGSLHYDNMGNFFRSLGFKNFFDMKDLNPEKKYKENLTSVDDQSMLDKFEEVAKKQGDLPFLSVFITMNSHFPFWTPHKEFEISDDPYKNALHYQDHLIGKLESILKKYKLQENTLLVITGDHGRREVHQQKAFTPESLFKIPLIIAGGEIERKKIDYPTNHAFVGSSLHKWAVGEGHGHLDFNLFSKRESLLFFETDAKYFTLLSKEGSYTYDGDKIYKEKKGLPHLNSKVCQQGDCKEVEKKFFDIFFNLVEHFK